MHTNKSHPVWEEEPDSGKGKAGHVQTNTPEEDDFILSYDEMIRNERARMAEFDPLVKLKQEDNKRVVSIKQILSFAASIIVVVSLFFAYQGYQQKHAQNQEIAEIQKNTTQALLHFSKELNACLTQLEDAQMKLGEPVTNMEALKNININKKNPFTNINFDQL